MRFVKMHGLGNDYVYIDGFNQRVEDPAGLAVRIADRHFGVGGDGLILVLPPTHGSGAHVRMRMFNADGSESEMCGNGVRCVCKFAHDHGLAPADANPMRVETGRGVLTLRYQTDGGRGGAGRRVSQVEVDMGEPILEPPDVPVDPDRLEPTGEPHTFAVAAEGVEVALPATFVSMGNPHAVIYVPEVAAIELERIGPKLEHHKAFPRRMNVHFVQAHSREEVTMRTWERGSGITLACGTGASAVCVAGVLTGRTGRKIVAHLPGGDLRLEWREAGEGAGHVFMTGPAVEVFRGEWDERGEA